MSVEPPWISWRFSRFLTPARTMPSKSTPWCSKKRRSSTATTAFLMFCGISLRGDRRAQLVGLDEAEARAVGGVDARGRAQLDRLRGVERRRGVRDADDPADDASAPRSGPRPRAGRGPGGSLPLDLAGCAASGVFARVGTCRTDPRVEKGSPLRAEPLCLVTRSRRAARRPRAAPGGRPRAGPPRARDAPTSRPAGPATSTATPVSVMSATRASRTSSSAERASSAVVSSASGASQTVTSSATVDERIESLRRTPAARRSLGMISRASLPIRSHV